MASMPVRRYVVKQIEAQGGWSVIYARLANGESIAEIATTLFRPDGPAINRRTLSMLLHQTPEREAATAAAVATWRQHPEPLRRALRKASKAARLEARAQAADRSQRDRIQAVMHGTTPAELPRYTMPARPMPRPPMPPPPVPRPVAAEPEPEPPTAPTGTEWRDDNGGYAWCHDCHRGDCTHARVAYARRAQEYARLHPTRPWINPGLV
jgi:hypothetical protein